MKPLTCRICGEAHWGECPKRVERISIRQAVARVRAKAEPDDGKGLVAPPGLCPYCDRRREYTKTKMSELRGRRKGGAVQP